MIQDIPKVGVVFLARKADGLDAFRRFVQSYLKYESGYTHELIVALKGFNSDSDINAAREIFSKITHLEYRLNDVGFDIGSYLEISEMVSHDYLCFFNTHTEIVASDWLKLLMKYATKEGVGIAAAMGSYESLNQSWKLIQIFYWLFYLKHIPYTRKIDRFYKKFRDYLPGAPSKKITDYGIFFKILEGFPYAIFLRAYLFFNIKEYEAEWVRLTSQGEMFQDLESIPPFPNPHIRSNAFLVKRTMLDFFCSSEMLDKSDACNFESGLNSLTRKILDLNLSAVVVGKNGVGYGVDEWGNSNTFRQGNQSNLLISDNHTRAFDLMATEDQALHQLMTWGHSSVLNKVPYIGIKFNKPSQSNSY